jgi:serine/threonine-protein kinase
VTPTRKNRRKTRSVPDAPSGSVLGLLVALGAAAALWALFQWHELVVVRLGGESFCSINEVLDCSGVWDSPLASSVHRLTGLPIAGWGLCWGVVALALPLLCLVARAEERPFRGGVEAVALTAAAGVASVAVMAAASFAEGKLCITCLGTYVLVLGYGAAAWRLWRGRGLPLTRPALQLALGATLVVYLALLVPGLRTPRGAAPNALAELAAATAAAPAAPRPAPAPSDAGGRELPGIDLAKFLGSLPPRSLQSLSDSLEIYRRASPVPPKPPRALEGPAFAPVRITEFSDPLCGHCASLHETLRMLEQMVPREQFAVDARQFPLDGGCNDVIDAPAANPVRCLAAKAQICMEGRPGRAAFVDSLFARQRELDEALIYRLAEPGMSRAELEACVASSETLRKLAADVAWADSLGIEGTPLVLVNGRRATSFAPFLLAITLTEGDADHPAFAGLPPPNPRAHMH